MIRSFRSKALERFWWKGEVHRIDQRHAGKCNRILRALEDAREPAEMDIQSFRFHPLTGDQTGRYSVEIDKNWRITFAWAMSDAVDVDYEDYH